MIDRNILRCTKPVLIKVEDTFITDVLISELGKEYPEQRCTICYDGEEFTTQINRGDLFSSDSKILILRYLDDDSVPLVSVLLDYNTEDRLILIQKNTLKRNRAYQNIKSNCSYFKLEKVSDVACKKWLSDFIVDNKLSTKMDLPGYLVNKVGNNLSLLYHEIKKIKLFSAGSEITKEVCDSIVYSVSEIDKYQFIDNFVHKRKSKVIKDLEKIDESQHIPLLHFLLNYLNKLYTISIYRVQKKSVDEISDMVNIPPFIIRTKYFTALSVYSKGKILKLFDILNDLDLKLRLSKYNKKVLFNIYIMKALYL